MPSTTICGGLYYWKGRPRMENRISRLEDEIINLRERVAAAESSIKGIKEDVSSIKDNTTWILRLIIGGLIGGILTFIIQGGFNL